MKKNIHLNIQIRKQVWNRALGSQVVPCCHRYVHHLSHFTELWQLSFQAIWEPNSLFDFKQLLKFPSSFIHRYVVRHIAITCIFMVHLLPSLNHAPHVLWSQKLTMKTYCLVEYTCRKFTWKHHQGSQSLRHPKVFLSSGSCVSVWVFICLFCFFGVFFFIFLLMHTSQYFVSAYFVCKGNAKQFLIQK